MSEVTKTALDSADETPFESLYRSYLGPLIGTVNRIVRNDEIAKEIAHDAFTTVLKEGLPPKQCEARRRVTVIARNNAIDQFRKRKTHALLDREYQEHVLAKPYDAASPENSSIANTELERVWAVFETLPPQQQEIVKLARFTKYDNAAIADKLGISVSNVSTSLRRAMIACASAIGEDE